MSEPTNTSGAAMLAIALAVSVTAAHAADPARIALSAAPASVTVYNDQAAVTRTGSAEIPAGDSILIVGGVPAGILSDSVNARGKAVGRVSIGSVEVRQVSFDPAEGNRRRAEIAARIRTVDDEIAVLEVRIASLTARQDFVDKMAAAAATTLPRPVPPAGSAAPSRLVDDPALWKSAAAIIGSETQETGDALRQAAIERRGLDETKQALAAQLAQAGGRPSGALEFAVAVSAEAPTRIDLSVTYQVRGASWRPVYEARLDTASGQVALRQEAVVAQRTGEDWGNVALTLSTSRPSAGVQPPDVNPWRIALIDPAAQMAVGSMSAPASPAPVMADMAVRAQRSAEATAAVPPPPPPTEVVAVAATQVVAGLSVEYGIPGAATVRSDGTERRVRISDLSADSTLLVRAVPRVEPRGYLFALFKSPAKTPLLAGAAALYLDGVFVGRTQLSLIRPGEEARIPFGPDDRVKVSYEPQAAKRSSDWGLMQGRRNMQAFNGLSVVRSFHDRPVTVTILDQVPISSDADLKVEETADPKPTQRDVDDRPGVVSWTYDMKPGEERRIVFGYTINAPQGKTISGMPRG